MLVMAHQPAASRNASTARCIVSAFTSSNGHSPAKQKVAALISASNWAAVSLTFLALPARRRLPLLRLGWLTPLSPPRSRGDIQSSAALCMAPSASPPVFPHWFVNEGSHAIRAPVVPGHNPVDRDLIG